MRRCKERYEELGYDGLFDRRLGKPSPKRVPLATVMTALREVSDDESNSLSRVDCTGLEMAARGFAKKRELKCAPNRLAAMRWARTAWHSWRSHSRRLWHKQTATHHMSKCLARK
jgi:hypothetical protein